MGWNFPQESFQSKVVRHHRLTLTPDCFEDTLACPSVLCGRMVLYSVRHRSIKILASSKVSKISPFSYSSRSFPLNDSL